MLSRLIESLFNAISRPFRRNRAPVLQDPQQFRDEWLTLDLPRNWTTPKVEHLDLEGGYAVRSLTVTTAHDNTFFLQITYPSVGTDLASFAESTVEDFSESIGNAFRLGPIRPSKVGRWQIEPIETTIDGTLSHGVRLETEVQVVRVGVLSRFELFHLEHPNFAAHIFYHAVDDEWESEAPGFAMILATLEFDRPSRASPVA